MRCAHSCATPTLAADHVSARSWMDMGEEGWTNKFDLQPWQVRKAAAIRKALEKVPKLWAESRTETQWTDPGDPDVILNTRQLAEGRRVGLWEYGPWDRRVRRGAAHMLARLFGVAWAFAGTSCRTALTP